MTEEGRELDQFIDAVKYENANLDSVLKQVPSEDRCILILSMAIAVDCMDWTDPDKAVQMCIDSVRSVTQYAVEYREMWNPAPLALNRDEPSTDEWNDLFMDSQALFRNLLNANIDALNGDVEEAYKESTFCLTYMLAAACARCEDSVDYACDSMNKTLTFIKEHCRLEERKL